VPTSRRAIGRNMQHRASLPSLVASSPLASETALPPYHRCRSFPCPYRCPCPCPCPCPYPCASLHLHLHLHLHLAPFPCFFPCLFHCFPPAVDRGGHGVRRTWHRAIAKDAQEGGCPSEEGELSAEGQVIQRPRVRRVSVRSSFAGGAGRCQVSQLAIGCTTCAATAQCNFSFLCKGNRGVECGVHSIIRYYILANGQMAAGTKVSIVWTAICIYMAWQCCSRVTRSSMPATYNMLDASGVQT
jgi:hypothetical protein